MENETQIFGIRAIIEAVNSGKTIDKVFVQKGLKGELFQELDSLLRREQINTSYVPIEKLNRLSNKNHQGVVAQISPIEFYDLDNFVKGKTSLNSIELDLLGDVKGKTILHLQCHFGQDTISLSRLGAEVTGIDLSDKAIQSAQQIAKDTHSNANFICCDIYDLPNHLDKQFDIVFTSYGTIGWLPDLDKWANIVSHYLKPNGQFVFVEFHPVVWMFDDNFEKIGYNDF